MALIKSISGMRGTIGGSPNENLTPIDIVEMITAYGQWIIDQKISKKVVVGRDGRISGPIVSSLAVNTLLSLGIDVVDLGFSTTPTVEMAVTAENAGGGIIFTASHNPKEWNALKLLNNKGEFISAQDGQTLLESAEKRDFDYASVSDLGKIIPSKDYIKYHIDKIIDLPYVDLDKIKSQNFKVVVDCINSTGAMSLPPLLDRMNVDYVLINDEITGEFAHNPEPVPANLSYLAHKVVEHKADLGIAVDPDVDRLVFVCEDGSMFSEEYTIVAIADYLLKHKKGPTVSNLSSSRALRDVTKARGCEYYTSAVGEVNVVNQMKAVGAVFGGEGNGGVILPDLHYGRDALVGIALMLNHLVDEGLSLSNLKKKYPDYHIVKTKIQLDVNTDIDAIISKVKTHYADENLITIDGLKIDFEESWVHIRKSNTEPIIRIIAEALSEAKANDLIADIKNLLDE